MISDMVRLDDGAPDPVPLWEKAKAMIASLETDPPVHREESLPNWDEEIAVFDGNGMKLFGYHSDGTVDVIDPERVPEAAVIFFRTVVEIAELQGFTVRKMP